jgi:CheY-like chemotaxis protein
VTIMNGQIGMESKLGEGSNFWFTVQLEKQVGEALLRQKMDEKPFDLPVNPLHAPVLDPKPKLKNVRILLAEDNSVNQCLALGQLEKLNDTANAVADGLEVLRSLEQISYGILLMDCHMPEMDGFEATRVIRMREQSFEKPCPWKAPVYIIGLTANATQIDRAECLAVGMDDYLSKPLQASELQAALERWKCAVQN